MMTAVLLEILTTLAWPFTVLIAVWIALEGVRTMVSRSQDLDERNVKAAETVAEYRKEFIGLDRRIAELDKQMRSERSFTALSGRK